MLRLTATSPEGEWVVSLIWSEVTDSYGLYWTRASDPILRCAVVAAVRFENDK